MRVSTLSLLTILRLVQISYALVTLETIRNLTDVTEECRLGVELAERDGSARGITQQQQHPILGGEMAGQGLSTGKDRNEVEIVSFLNYGMYRVI